MFLPATLLLALLTLPPDCPDLPQDASATTGGAPGTLEVSFAFKKASGMVPSYQIAVWLEDESGKYVKTLFLSEYLSAGGYGLDYVCPDWVKQAQWDKAPESEYDAVTRPTPKVGSTTLKFDALKRGIVPGKYRFCLQVHLVGKLNILHRGEITVGAEAAEAPAEVFYTPERPPEGADVVVAVRARWVPAAGADQQNSSRKD
jgi:hypothetical protein